MSTRSLPDCMRFGLEVHRFRFETFSDDLIVKLFHVRPDIAILRLPAEHLQNLLRSSAVRTLTPIVADTLVYYSRIAKDSSPPLEIRNSKTQYRRGEAPDLQGLLKTARKAFTGYINHYSANPLLKRQLILEGFEEWASTFLQGSPDKRLWVATSGDVVVGFIGCQVHGRELTIALNAVDPSFAGQGIYGDLLSFVLAATSTEFEQVTISTQVHNLAVQRVWQARGFRITKALNTIHFNLLLANNGNPTKSVSFSNLENLRDEVSRLKERAIDRELDLLIAATNLSSQQHQFPEQGRLVYRSGKYAPQIVIENASADVVYVNNQF